MKEKAVYNLPKDSVNPLESFHCFPLDQENIQYGETRGRHGSHKIDLPFGLDCNNKMSESPHGTLI